MSVPTTDLEQSPRSMEIIMGYLNTLLQRNGEFADQGFNPNLKMMPSSKSLIIGCVDPAPTRRTSSSWSRARPPSSVMSAIV